jgi:hypothetical protein
MADARAPTALAEEPQPTGRLLLGAGIFAFGIVCPLFVPLVQKASWGTELKVAVSGLLLFGIPELFMMAAASVLGKTGFEFLKRKTFAFIARHGPADRVGPTRYRVGLVMFVLPLAFGLLSPYAGHLIPGYAAHTLAYALAGDALLLGSLLVLGGDFWDKLRSLFVHDAKAAFP